MYPIPPTETLVETKICRHCSVSFPITDKDLEFYEKVSPVFPSGGVSRSDGVESKKYLIPTPTLCPDCRLQRRFSWRNERKLYKRKCNLTGKEIISIFSPDKPYKVYESGEWWSDKWDATSYGRDFNFGKSFFEQWDRLFHDVPKVNLGGMGNENSEYTNFAMYSKDSYLIISGRNNEKCLYSRNIRDCKDTVDCLQIVGSENTYDTTVCFGCSNVFHSFHVFNCQDSSYLYACEGCSHCFGCINLTNKQYHIFNGGYSEKDYFQEVKKLSLLSRQELQEKVNKFFLTKPRRFLNIQNNEGECSNDYIRNSKNVRNSIHIAECEDVAHSFEQEKSQNIQDCCMGGGGNQYVYESVAIGMNEYKNAFCVTFTNLQTSFYCESCYDSSNLFGCVGLRNKQYCILNKQYTKEQYEELVPKIIEHMKKTGEWGEFFPSSLSPFGYNETVAMEYFPLDRRDTINRVSTDGKSVFNWSDYEPPFPKVEKIIPASKLPEDITKIPDDILNWAIECEVTGKPFRIIKQELEFYRKHNLPIPRRHPDQRHLDRMSLRNPRKLYNRKCDKCGVEMMTTYSVERPEEVYCESCYNKEIIG